MTLDQDNIRARFCHALSEMYKAEVPLYGDLVDLVWQADAEALQSSQQQQLSNTTINPDEILPARNRVERHGAIRLGTPRELSTIRRMFAVMGMSPVGYYDLSTAGFPMHATAFRPRTREALARHPFRVFTTVLRMELVSERTRALAERALARREIFSPRLLELLDLAERKGTLSGAECDEFIAEGLGAGYLPVAFARDGHAGGGEHPLVADIVSFPSCHINHLTPRTIDIDLVQRMMRERGMPAKERIEGPPRRAHPILLRQASFKALEETVYFRDARNEYVRGSHTARFGEVEQRGYALTRKGRQLYDQILARVNREAGGSVVYATILRKHFEEFPDDLAQLQAQKLAFFCYSVTPHASKRDYQGIDYEPITYEDFLPLSAGGIFNSNLANTSQAKQLIMEADTDLDGFQRMLGAPVLDEFCLYEQIQQESLETCRQQLGVGSIEGDSDIISFH
ncbi:hypothetical protein Aspvir_005291 [Aspergillus viridinutans]|uniref:2-oxoadipate dioxygenase/decarboxylase n=1 Tax=Aspergillus viridinutans TaxID=75553 RepID=A0A9P3F1B6_ASPVI|nr:uncharacterized protein Aspvir_005291 [Aspergillus viridinutans]GIK01259.1 hypothetical protein Aspvir_005291 [Aspergillus viridinutans]